MRRILPLLGLLTLLAPAQAPRTVRDFDGAPWERVSVQGEGRFVREKDAFVQGLGALEVRPAEGKTWFGVRVFRVPVFKPKRLLLNVFNPTESVFPLRVNVFDEESKGKRVRAARKEAPCQPGWSEVSIDLTTVKSYANQRDLDIGRRIAQLEISARRDDLKGEARLIFDDLRCVGEEGGRHAIARLREGIAVDDQKKRARAVRDNLPFLSEPDRLRLSLEILEKEKHPWIRVIARDTLGGLAHEASAKQLIKTLGRTRGARRVELLAALSSMPSPVARAEAMRLVTRIKNPEELASLVRHMTRLEGAASLLPLVDAVAPRGAWQPRAALVEALARTACPEGIDGLISMLAQKNDDRVEGDLVDALASLTGKDIGTDARAWKAWWAENRGKIEIAREPKPYQRKGYSFFGIPVRRGRVAFIIDSSGSMDRAVVGGKGADYLVTAPHLKDKKIETRFDLAREELLHAVRGLEEGASFAGIILCNDEAYWVTKGLEKVGRASREKMEKRVRSFKARFKGNFHAGFEAAFHPEGKPSPRDVKKGPDTIFFLSDGHPSAGEVQDQRDLRDAINTWNLGRMIRIHTVNVGAGGSALLSGISRRSGGRFVDLSSERRGPPKRGKEPKKDGAK